MRRSRFTNQRVIEYAPTYTSVRYYRGTRPTYRNLDIEKPGWTNWKFHTALYTGLFVLTFAFLGIKNTDITPIKDQPVKAYTGEEEVLSKLISPLPKKSSTPITQTKQATEDWGDFVTAVQEIAPIFDFPVKVAVAMGAHESAYGTSMLAQVKNNYYGLNAVDWDPFNSAWSFANQKECIIRYMQLIKYEYPEAYANRDNPELMLKLIKQGGYASDPLYYYKVTQLPEWKRY